jgi:ribosome-binding factor A
MRDNRRKEPSQRQLRVGEELRHILASIMERENHTNEFLHNTYITVTEVKVSPDLRHAKVYVMPMGGKNLIDVVKALNEIAPSLRSKLGRELTTKFTPALHFEADLSYDEADRISKILQSESDRVKK